MSSSTTRATAQSSLAAVQEAGSTSSATTLAAVARHALAVGRGRVPLSTPSCVNGQTTADVTNADGSTTSTQTTYYDAACTQPSQAIVVNVPALAPGATSISGTGTLTTYSVAGSVTGYTTMSLTIAISGSTTVVTLVASQATTVGGAPYANLGITCSAALAGTSVQCGAANVVTTGGTQVGASVALTLTSVTAAWATTRTATMSASAYSAASGLAIAQGAVPAWSVTGGSPVATIGGTVSATVTGSQVTNATITLTGPGGVTVNGSAAGGNYAITVQQNGVTQGSVTVNASGNGTITYAGGTTATIANWIVNG